MTRKNAKLAPVILTANGLDTDRPPSEVVEKPIRNHDDNGRFIAGNNLGQGRPKGSRNQLSEFFCEALRDDFAKHGAAAIVKLREEDPATYVRVIATLVPKEIKADIDQNSHITILLSAPTGTHAELEAQMRNNGRIPDGAMIVNMLPGDEDL